MARLLFNNVRQAAVEPSYEAQFISSHKLSIIAKFDKLCLFYRSICPMHNILHFHHYIKHITYEN